MILAIDPGPEQSGVAVYDAAQRALRRLEVPFLPGGVLAAGVVSNRDLEAALAFLARPIPVHRPILAVEWVESYGLGVGASVFHTCRWVGRFERAWGADAVLVPRRDVKVLLCGGTTWKNPATGARKGVTDAQVNAAIRERFPATGGGRYPAVGTKRQPGPLYGVTSHAYAALGVALTVADDAG